MSEAHGGERGRIHRINRSNGGVPKLPVPEAAVTRLGLVGDRQRQRRFHGGPKRALCLYALERIETLRAEGHPIAPGTIGENVTVEGVPWEAVVPGAVLRLGEEVVVEVTSYTAPCSTIAGSFADGRFARVSQKVHPGDSRVYVRVLREGTIREGDAVRLVEAGWGGSCR